MIKSTRVERTRAASVIVFSVAFFGGFATAQEELMFPLDEAPAGALAAAQAAAPDVTFEGVDVEVEDGVVTLEFVGRRPDGTKVEVDLANDWVALEVEEVIDLADVPEAVRETLAIQMGEAFAPTSVERSARGSANVYEFEGVDANGREIDIEIEADGESIVVLDDRDT